ncbi:MAG: alpha-L-rhamnosidase [Saprospiraceae bacterium]|jgi:hypothetical protein|nr:alpha-L-rhamnosidase [Saprospiraceae bacterium]MBK8512455.1 alpha-L-rhamnosidase [Saprospiraceae bacterium]MBP7922886.1 alpha-L-rhamnosidase [Saprospiraceae bacterium]MBP9746305.1 alpha-L-rhamnosidase [Saprospiraceae bacterium]
MRLLQALLIILWYPVIAVSQQLPAPTNLRCDLLLHPEKVSLHGLETAMTLTEALSVQKKYEYAKIFNQTPKLFWQVDTTIKKVKAYRILVASDTETLKRNKGDLWDSKRIRSSQQSATYEGKSLKPGKIYYWKVQIWNEKNGKSPYSSAQSFSLSDTDSAGSFAHYPLAAELQSPVSIEQRKDGVYFIDFAKDALSQLQLHLTSLEDDTLMIEVGEALEKPGHIHKNPGRNIRYLKIALPISKGTGDYTLDWPYNELRNSRNPVLMPEYIGEVYPFRYVTITNFKGKLTSSDIKRKMIHYPFDQQASSFTSSDTVLNQVWDLCKYSMKATSFTGFYVDGDRERIPYEADALINQLSHYAVDAEYSMARRTLEYLIFHPTWPTEWSLQNVLMAWNDYLYTGDDAFIKKYYSQLQKKMLLPLAGADGLISTRTDKQTDAFLTSIHINKDFDRRRGLHDIVDWPQSGDYIGDEKAFSGETDGFVFNRYNAVVNAFYYRNLVLMQQISTALHKTADAAFYANKANQVYHSFQEVFRHPNSGLIKDGDSTDHVSLHSNMFALAFGLVPPDDKTRVVQFIESRKMACSVYGSQFLLDALFEAGQTDYALELLTATTQRSWYNMIRIGSTISLEAWDKVYKPNLDWNHAWGAAPANLIVRHLMGVMPLTPGGEILQIKPQIGHLDFAHLTTPTIRGIVSVFFDRRPGKDLLEVFIPGGTMAKIFVPSTKSTSKLYMNGIRQPLTPVDGFFEVQNQLAGRHQFEVK